MKNMQRILPALLMTLAMVGLLTGTPAEAKRLGGGSSLGMKRTTATPAQAPAAAPQAPATPANSAAPAAASSTPAPNSPVPASGFSRWLGPLAGLGIGAGLMALFGGSALGAMLGSVFTVLLLAAAAYFILQFFRRKTQSAHTPAMHYADAGVAPDTYAMPTSSDSHDPYASTVSSKESAPSLSSLKAPDVNKNLQGFDKEGFLRQAKISFLRLQAANDAKDLRDLRSFTTPELYAELAQQINERNNARQHTEVVMLNVELLEITNEQECLVASVRYSGRICEDAEATAVDFGETWHVIKDLKHPSPAWYIAGIQQDEASNAS